MAQRAHIVGSDDGRIRIMARGGAAAAVEDLYRVPEHGKAEIVGGRLVVMSPAGGLHGYAAGAIFASLHQFARHTGAGVALPDNVGFVVDLPHRRSFSPDAAFWTGAPLMAAFPEGAPAFAVEVRSDEDYGPAAERALAAKRADYFAAGTQVVWDVDVLREGAVRVFRAAGPRRPAVHRRGERADAEPVVPGWSMPVDDLFPG
jgi:Uma2 family endonuclease